MARQNTAHNQPSHPGFFRGDGVPAAPRPVVHPP
ncbi:hypothetical protein ABZ391_25990 [Kitasatospora cineracea]